LRRQRQRSLIQENNGARSAQNTAQLARIGVYDSVEGRALLQRHFDDVVSSDGNIANDYGEFQIRDSLFAGPGGFVYFETTWQITDGGLRLTTVIPKGGP
jgi:filamentous hemagglutinin